MGVLEVAQFMGVLVVISVRTAAIVLVVDDREINILIGHSILW